MLWEEKHGGIWSAELNIGDDVVFTRHVPSADLIAYLVHSRKQGYIASVWRKTHYRKWRLPFWIPAEPPATFASEAEADAYLAELIGTLEADAREQLAARPHKSEDLVDMPASTLPANNVVYLFPPKKPS